MSIISNSLSGLRAAQDRVAVAAQNIANASTPNAKALDYSQTSDGTGGVKSVVTNRNPATVPTLDGEGNEVDLPNVSLDEEAVNTQLAVNDFQANAQVLKTAKDLQKHLVDILA